MEEEIYKMSLDHLVAPESKKVLKKEKKERKKTKKKRVLWYPALHLGL